MPEGGYPTEDELAAFAEYQDGDAIGFLWYARQLWAYQDWGWPEFEVTEPWTTASTAGWSGNESIISAMMDNTVLWNQVFAHRRAGGHYVFRVMAPPGAVPPARLTDPFGKEETDAPTRLPEGDAPGSDGDRLPAGPAA